MMMRAVRSSRGGHDGWMDGGGDGDDCDGSKVL